MSFTVYRSSAGSGKTYTLVKEYLRIVLQRPSDYSSILAITFTNKAANEMRDRIVSYLKDISDPATHSESVAVKQMLPELEARTGIKSEKLVENADQVLKSILHNYQDFSVGTIDSFIHRIIRTFAFDLHLPLNFEVEVDAKAMVAMAVDLLLSKVGVEDVPTRVLKKYTESRILDEKNWDIEKDLTAFANQLMKDDINEFLPLLHMMKTEAILDTSNVLIRHIRSFEKEAERQAFALEKLWNENGIEMADLSRGRSGIYGFVHRLATGDFSNLKVNSYVSATLGEDKWCSGKATSETIALIDSLKGQMLLMAGELVNHIETGEATYIFYKLLKRNIFNLAILNEIEEVIDQIRIAEGIIHISEFDKRIADVVNNEPVPFIYERLGERYKHFLIDEFQDTSVLEWQNILPLIENALATGQFNMIVGDTKQAIYRFKGGEVDQLALLPKIYKRGNSPEMISMESQLEHFYTKENLKYNFRSRKEIIEFNNDLYSYLSGKLPEELKTFYDECEQEQMKEKAGGEVRISFIDEEGKNEVKEPFYFDSIRSYVKEMTEEKGYAYSDIAILCRSNNHASKIARDLLIHGIEVISAESLLLSSSPEVNFLVFCLDFISNSEDKVARAGIINYLSNKETEINLQEILKKCLPDKHTPGEGHSLKNLYNYFKSLGITFLADELNQMGLYERLESLIRMFDLNASPDPYVIFFMDAVFDYSRDKKLLPEDFTSYWRDQNKKYSIVVPEGMNAVSVMTIHKAKGLEFPVVIYPFANSEVNISKDKKWIVVDDADLPGLHAALLPLTNDLCKTTYAGIHAEEKNKALLDMINILYVATTRPTERLLLICDRAMVKNDNMLNIPSVLKSFLEDKGLWEETENLYQFGKSEVLPAGATEKNEVLTPVSFISGDWRKNILLSGHAAEYWDLEDEGRNREWGNLIHNILSGIVTVDDLESALEAEMAQGNILVSEAPKINELLQDILHKPDLKHFYDGSFEVRNESAIMTKAGREYRPDRLMIKDNMAIVLDYKTGMEDPSHIRQLETYGHLMEEMGYSGIERYLLYIDDSCRLVKV